MKKLEFARLVSRQPGIVKVHLSLFNHSLFVFCIQKYSQSCLHSVVLYSRHRSAGTLAFKCKCILAVKYLMFNTMSPFNFNVKFFCLISLGLDSSARVIGTSGP